MIEKEEYLKAKQIVQEYEKQLNISDVSKWLCITEKYCKLKNIDRTCMENDVCCCYKVSKTVC